MKMGASPESYRRESKGSVLGSLRIEKRFVWLCTHNNKI